MRRVVSLFAVRLVSILFGPINDILRFAIGLTKPRTALTAENLLLRKQLAFYRERKVKPLRLTDSARLSLLFWSSWLDWRDVLVVVKPETLIGWHRKALLMFWRWKSREGRPRLPKDLRALIAEMVRENPMWGEMRVALELGLKLGIRVSPGTVRVYRPQDLKPRCCPSNQERPHVSLAPDFPEPATGLPVMWQAEDIRFPPPSASGRKLSLVGCTTNIGLKGWRHDSDEVFAQHRAVPAKRRGPSF